MDSRKQKTYVRAATVRERYGDISEMTMRRWEAAGILPQPLVVGGQKFFDEELLAQVGHRTFERGTVQRPPRTAEQEEADRRRMALARSRRKCKAGTSESAAQ